MGSPARITAIAHRGDSAAHPENTAAAFDAAAAAGADGIELDLRPTADGGVVVCHDASLARFGGSRRPLARRRLAELARCDVGSWRDARFAAERLVTLDALLERYAGMELLLELKAAGGLGSGRLNRRLSRLTAEAIARHRAHDRVYAMSFSLAILRELARLDPKLRLGRISYRAGRDVARWLRRQPPLRAVSLDWPAATAAVVRACHEAGLAVYVWTCNDERAIDRPLAAGVDGILSDRPGWLIAQLRRRGLR